MQLNKIFFLIFICLTVLSLVVLVNKLKTFDLTITNSVENLIPRSLDLPLSVFSIIGTFEVTTLFLASFLVLRKKQNGILVFFLFFIGSVIEILGKTFIHHASPPSRFFRYDLNFIFPSSNFQTGYSFPSGHMMRITFIVVTFLILLFKSKMLISRKKILAISLVLFLIIMALSRISLGEHWASDVIAGFLLGLGLGLINLKFL